MINKIKDQRSKIKIFVLLAIAIFLLAGPVAALAEPEAKLTSLIRDYVAATYPDWGQLNIKVKFKFADKLFERLAGFSDQATFKVVDVYHDFKPVGNVIFPVLIDENGKQSKVFVRAKVEVFKDVVVAQQLIKRGQVIGAEDLALTQRDIAMLPQSYFAAVAEVIGTEAKTSIPKNSLVFHWMVKEVPLVRRGQLVTLIVKGQNLLLRTPGEVLMDGYLNGDVRVRKQGVKDPKKIMLGRLISSDEVELLLK